MSINLLFEIILILSTVVILISYHIHLYLKVRRDPMTTAIGITNHAREMWVKGIIRDKRDILAVQTLRNRSAAFSGLMVFIARPEPSSKPFGIVVRGQSSRCQ